MPAGRSLAEQLIEQQIGQRLHFGDDALVGRIVRDEPAEIGDVGESERHILGQIERTGSLARSPEAHDAPPGIGHRGGDGMPPPETG